MNRTGTTDGPTRTWAYDSANLPCWTDNQAYSPQSAGCDYRPPTYTHDANGSDLDNKHQTYTYNSANQPTTTSIWSLTGTQQLAFRGTGTSQLVQDGSNALQHNILGIGVRGGAYYARAVDGTVTSERASAGRRNYLYDPEGSVVGLTDATTGGATTRASGSSIVNYRYEPYGHPTNTTPRGDENPFGYLGSYTAGSGNAGVICGGAMVFGGSFYDAQDARFTALSFVDPFGGLSNAIDAQFNRFGNALLYPVRDGQARQGLLEAVAGTAGAIAGAISFAACAVGGGEVDLAAHCVIGPGSATMASIGLVADGVHRIVKPR